MNILDYIFSNLDAVTNLIGIFIAVIGFSQFKKSGTKSSIGYFLCFLGILIFLSGYFFRFLSSDIFNKQNNQDFIDQSSLEEITSEKEIITEEEFITKLPEKEYSNPILEHFSVYVGTGIFEIGTFSSGLLDLTDDQLWDLGHQKVQRIRTQEYPEGCDTARYDSDFVWISGTKGMKFSVNDEIIGEYLIADDPHGYIFNYSISMGDKLCVVDFLPNHYSIFLGPDIFYHYDSYCFRGYCIF